MALQEKYKAVIDMINSSGGRELKVTEDGGVLRISATVPTPTEKIAVWNKIKEIGGANPTEITADIKMDNADAKAEAQKTYVVKSGDTLSKISKEMYGDANKYMNIFNANKDKLSDPDKINPGMELNIP